MREGRTRGLSRVDERTICPAGGSVKVGCDRAAREISTPRRDYTQLCERQRLHLSWD
jgi:hypothetical protein